MELHIKTTGMCLIVPEVSSGVIQRYHLLLPETEHHIHNAILIYKGAGPGFDLRCRSLDLTGLSADQGSADLYNVIDVGTLVDGVVPARQVGQSPDTTVRARITLPVPTWTMLGETAPWQPIRHDHVARPVFPSTHHITWVYENCNPASLSLLLQQLHPCGTTAQLPAPTPMNGVMCISIVHLPPVGPTVGVGQHSPHFPMYASIFDVNNSGLPAMKLKHPRMAPPLAFMCDDTEEPLLPIDESETAYNCMLAKADMG